MVEHYHGAHSGPYVVKASCLHILEDDWNKYQAEFEAAAEKLEAMERAAHGDEQRWIAGRRLWRLSEAVVYVTSMHGFGVSRHDLEERLSSHEESELLTVASLGSGKRSKADHLCVFVDNRVYAEDFNAWLEAAGFCEPYRLPLDASTIAEQVTPDTEAESASSSARSLTTSYIACAFAGLGRWNEDAWKSNLGNHRKWMLCAVVNRGARGVRETTWNPVLLASALIGLKKGVKAKSIRAKFQTHHLLKPFEGEWKDHEAMFHSDD